VALIGLCGIAALLSARLAVAGWLAERGSAASLELAVRLAPDSARYRRLLAESLNASDPGRARRSLERAAALNPYDAEVLVELGLRAEQAGEAKTAEEYLLAAAGASRRYRPRWSLAGFYLRTRRREEFWKWAREAAAIAPGDATPLYRLCWHVLPDPEAILSRVTPPTPRGRRQFLEFLFTVDHPEGILTVSELLIPGALPSDRGLLAGAADRLIARGRLDEALRIWNRTCAARVLPFAALDPEKGPRVTNPDFRRHPSGQGFDWRLARDEGATASVDPAAPAIRLRLTGRQPERATLLAQYVPVPSRGSGRLAFRYRTSDLPEPSGIVWRVTDAAEGTVLAAAPVRSSARTATRSVPLAGSPRSGFLKLALCFERPVGRPKTRGWIEIGGVEVGWMR
jgi:hypothetical protein